MKKFKINPKSTYKIFENKIHLLDYKTATINSLNETATFIWLNLKKPISKKELTEVVHNEFEVSLEEVKRDIDKLLKDFIEKGFVVEL